MCIYPRVFQTTTIRLPSHHFPQDSLHHLSLIFQPSLINHSPLLRTWTMLQTMFSSSQRGMVTANTTLTKWSQQSGSQTPWFRWHLTAPPRAGSECSTPSLRRSGGTATSMSSSGNFMMILMMMMMLWCHHQGAGSIKTQRLHVLDTPGQDRPDLHPCQHTPGRTGIANMQKKNSLKITEKLRPLTIYLAFNRNLNWSIFSDFQLSKVLFFNNCLVANIDPWLQPGRGQSSDTLSEQDQTVATFPAELSFERNQLQVRHNRFCTLQCTPINVQY